METLVRPLGLHTRWAGGVVPDSQPENVRIRVKVTIRRPRGTVEGRCEGCKRLLFAGGWRRDKTFAFLNTYFGEEWLSGAVWHRSCWEEVNDV